MRLRTGMLGCSLFALSFHPAGAGAAGSGATADPGSAPAAKIPLVVPAGVPLRVYLTRRVPKREGAPVEAKVLAPVYSFDREVIPAGASVLGRVARVSPVPRRERIAAVLGGDFTPLRVAGIEFTTLVMPDGRRLPLKTAEGGGLGSIADLRPPKHTQGGPPATTIAGRAKQKAAGAIHAQIDRVRSIPDLVRGPDKKEVIEDYLVSKLPYHPQYVRKGTRFDADLTQPLDFGSERPGAASLARIGAEPPPGAVAHARLLTALDSASSKPGETVEAVLAEPVYSADHSLILPEGTRVEGTVVSAKRARWFHRSGRLRFNFRQLELPETVAAARRELSFRTDAHLQAAENSGRARLNVDSEGGVQAKESKTRFLAAAAAVMVARRAGDNDPIRNRNREIIGQSQNVPGRTIGGAFGFGLVGSAISQSSRWVGAAFGYYGMARALFSTVFALGSEVRFEKNAAVDIRFDTRARAAAAGHGISE